LQTDAHDQEKAHCLIIPNRHSQMLDPVRQQCQEHDKWV